MIDSPVRTPTRTRGLLAAGSLLCTTALASAGGAWNPSTAMKVTSAYLKLVENGAYGTWTSPSTWTNLNGGAGSYFLDPTGINNPTVENWGNVAAGGNTLAGVAEFFGYSFLSLQAQAGTNMTTAGGTGTGWLDVTFVADSWVYAGGAYGDWSVNGVLVQDGDFFAAGTSLRFDMNHTWLNGQNGLSVSLMFSSFNPNPGTVPVPGAAGLAACGLALAGRRRRRG